jgi:hypothetical protein
MKKEPEHMDEKLFYSIISRAVKENIGATIVPWLNGEPLLHPSYYYFVRFLTQNKLRYYVTTNGMIHNEKIFEHIAGAESTCYQVIVSLDGLPHSKSIKKARPGTDSDRVLKSIEWLTDIKKKSGSDTDIAVKICRRGQDWEEIETYIQYWLRYGIDYVVVGDALEEENTGGMRRYPCRYSDNEFMVIKSDGRVVRCAYNSLATNDPVFTMGDANIDVPLLSIYNNENFTKFRKDQENGVFHFPCSVCGFAYTGYGFKGKIKFRKYTYLPPDTSVEYHRDYYNQFFSLKKKEKLDIYYHKGWQPHQKMYE